MFSESNLDCVHITFFLFLLKLPMIDIELLPTDMRHAISENFKFRYTTCFV